MRHAVISRDNQDWPKTDGQSHRQTDRQTRRSA